MSVGEPLPSDAGLAKRALAGDAHALAALLERSRPSLYTAAIGLLRNREEAHDAVQEACVVALVRIGSLRDPAAVGGWLHRIRNVCLMRLRGQTETRPHADLEVPGLAPSMDEVLERHMLRDWVWTAIDGLAPEDRVTVLLRHFTRSNSYEAIAAVTGVPVGTVRRSTRATRTDRGAACQHRYRRVSRRGPRSALTATDGQRRTLRSITRARDPSA